MLLVKMMIMNMVIMIMMITIDHDDFRLMVMYCMEEVISTRLRSSKESIQPDWRFLYYGKSSDAFKNLAN